MLPSRVLTIEQSGPTATLWLDHPAARNALGPDFWADLPRAMAEVAGQPEVRVVVLAGRGDHFSVGLDLKSEAVLGRSGGEAGSPAAEAARTRDEIRRLQASISSVAACPKPVIAAIHGYCLGGGLDLASACDIRLASADAVFSIRETRMAMVADLGSLQRLPLIIGWGHLAEMAYTGKDIGAERAKEMGLVSAVLPDRDATWGAAGEMAAAIAANSPLAVQGTKAVLSAAQGRAVVEGLEFVAAWNAAFLRSNDLAEALAAFRERRAPRFEGT